MGKVNEETFCSRGLKMVNKHIKRCSTSLAIREMQIKIMNYQYRAIGWLGDAGAWGGGSAWWKH